MKICPNCGFNAEDTAAFCPGCGTKLDAASEQSVSEAISPDTEQAVEVPEVQPLADESVSAAANEPVSTATEQQSEIPAAAPNTWQQNGRGYVEYSQMYARPNAMPYGMPSGAAVSTMKKVLSSPLALIIALGYSLIVILNYVSVIMLIITKPIFSSSLLNDYGLPTEINDFLYEANNFLNTYSNIVALFMFIGTSILLVVAIGMWATYAGAFGKDNGRMGTGGLTAIKAIVIFRLVGICCMFLLPIVMLILGLGFSADLGPENFTVIAIATIVITLILVLFVVYYAKLIKTINVIKGTAKTGVPNKNVSIFAAVMLIISGITGFIDVIISVTDSDFNWLSMIISVLSAVVTLLLGVLIFVYRSRMSDVMATASYPMQGNYPVQMPGNYPYNVQ